MQTLDLDLDLEAGDVRRALSAVYHDTCCIGSYKKMNGYKDTKCAGHGTIEHIYPRSLGGTDSLSNLAFTCAHHNNAKSNDISDMELIRFLKREAATHVIDMFNELLRVHAPQYRQTRGFYLLGILSHVYRIRITKKGSLWIVRESSKEDERKNRDAIPSIPHMCPVPITIDGKTGV